MSTQIAPHLPFIVYTLEFFCSSFPIDHCRLHVFLRIKCAAVICMHEENLTEFSIFIENTKKILLGIVLWKITAESEQCIELHQRLQVCVWEEWHSYALEKLLRLRVFCIAFLMFELPHCYLLLTEDVSYINEDFYYLSIICI